MPDALSILTGRDEMTLWHAALWLDFGLFAARPLWRLRRFTRRHHAALPPAYAVGRPAFIAAYMALAVLANTLLLARVLDHAPARGFILAALLATAAGLWVFWSVLALCRRGGNTPFILCFLLCAGLHMACLAAAWFGANHAGALIDPGVHALPTAALLALLPTPLIALTLRQSPPTRPQPPRSLRREAP